MDLENDLQTYVLISVKKKDLLKLEGMQTEQALHICYNCFILGFLDDYVQP